MNYSKYHLNKTNNKYGNFGAYNKSAQVNTVTFIRTENTPNLTLDEIEMFNKVQLEIPVRILNYKKHIIKYANEIATDASKSVFVEFDDIFLLTDRTISDEHRRFLYKLENINKDVQLVLKELIKNAIVHNQHHDCKIRVGLQKQNDVCAITVKDNGLFDNNKKNDVLNKLINRNNSNIVSKSQVTGYDKIIKQLSNSTILNTIEIFNNQKGLGTAVVVKLNCK